MCFCYLLFLAGAWAQEWEGLGLSVRSWHLMAKQVSSDPCPRLAVPECIWPAIQAGAAPDLCTEYSQHGSCNHLLSTYWGSGPIGRRDYRALHFHFAMELVDKWAAAKITEVGRNLLLNEYSLYMVSSLVQNLLVSTLEEEKNKFLHKGLTI